MGNAGNSAAVLEMREVYTMARAFGLEVTHLEIRRGEDIAKIFQAPGRVDALYVSADPLAAAHRIHINALAQGCIPAVTTALLGCAAEGNAYA